MTGREYEYHVAVRMRKAGYKYIELTKATGDYGADILAVDPYGRKVCVQCKYYTKKKVGVSAVQEVIAAKEYYRCSFAIVATHIGYTEAAQEMAKKTGVILWKL